MNEIQRSSQYISNNNFAGIATLPLLLDSISKLADIVVSKSEEDTCNWLLSNSNKKGYMNSVNTKA